MCINVLYLQDDISEKRLIYHYHFSAWPDHGVPGDPGPVLSFLQDINDQQENSINAGPSVVHCRFVRKCCIKYH